MKSHRIIIISAFVLAVWLPVLQMNLRFFKEYDGTENRELAKPPDFTSNSAGRLQQEIEDYLGDHFGFRPDLIRLHSMLKTQLLGISPIPSVILGKRSWLFYCSEALADGNTINDFRGTIPLSANELFKLTQRLEENQHEFSRRNIVYLVAIVPNKNTVYPELLPDDIRKFRSSTRLDQLVDYLKTHSTVRVLDLRDAMQRAKGRLHPYWKTDSHWNTYGAFVGYLEIINTLSHSIPALQPLSIVNDEVSVQGSPMGGDLAQMLLMQDLLPEENNTAFSLSSEPRSPQLNALIFRHDSFGDNLYPYFRRHFKNIINIAPFATYKYDALQDHHPEVALHVFAERYITQALHDDFFYEEEKE